MKLTDIPASADIRMTTRLMRLFRSVDCEPACPACRQLIAVGQMFKLVPHRKPESELTDEMCCQKCGKKELRARDKKEEAALLALALLTGHLMG